VTTRSDPARDFGTVRDGLDSGGRRDEAWRTQEVHVRRCTPDRVVASLRERSQCCGGRATAGCDLRRRRWADVPQKPARQWPNMSRNGELSNLIPLGSAYEW
jgi:hypothetical protein